ncbi:lytic polysaccharide monooxygenase [Streptomyces sp. NPDC005780]|uniref:lytic polysaccharide monooxygenase auxiliary activity family 9 protein n=1 Tax=Streptomyces sp. NPDC005780 TaxID=3364730 RepID=UPI0036B4A46A
MRPGNGGWPPGPSTSSPGPSASSPGRGGRRTRTGDLAPAHPFAVKHCGQIQWEPPSVEGPKGFPTRGPADGHICSGGIGRFSELDDPRGGARPATQVSAGQNHTFRRRIEARHATTDFRYYITRDGYDPSQPLTRADLEPQPFLTVPFGGSQPGSAVTHSGALPQKSGKHLILGVWTISDTGNAFYACSDVNF